VLERVNGVHIRSRFNLRKVQQVHQCTSDNEKIVRVSRSEIILREAAALLGEKIDHRSLVVSR
jgi:hypothetical protein